jgi:hypothetical protein
MPNGKKGRYISAELTKNKVFTYFLQQNRLNAIQHHTQQKHFN